MTASDRSGRLRAAFDHLVVLLPLWPILKFVQLNRNEDVDLAVIGVVTGGVLAMLVVTWGALRLLTTARQSYRVVLAASAVMCFAGFYFEITRLLPTEPVRLGVWVVAALGLATLCVLGARNDAFRLFAGLFSVLAVVSSAVEIAVEPGQLTLSAVANEPVSQEAGVTRLGRTGETPNVYVFVFDAYMRSDLLARHYGLDSELHVRALEERGFFVARKSRSNFPTTAYSVSFALHPFEVGHEDDVSSLRRRQYYLGRYPSSTQSWFRRKGYQFVMLNHLGRRRPGCEPHCIVTGGYETALSVRQLTHVQLLKTIPAYDFIRMFYPQTIDGWISRLPQDARVALTSMPKGIDGPFALFAHVLMPHPPYTMTASCQRRLFVDFEFEEERLDNTAARRLYSDAVRCANLQMLEIADRIRRSDPDALVVFTSDHGWKAENDPSARFANFWAAHVPVRCHSYLYDAISLVNTFPVIFACLEGAPPRVVSDRSFIVDGRERALDVTDRFAD